MASSLLCSAASTLQGLVMAAEILHIIRDINPQGIVTANLLSS
ncbi:MAG: hypothetical protein AAFY63_15880 [Cyanobacteria bacterium J06643_13]